MEGTSTRCMVVLAPADILSQGTGRDGRDSQLAWEINRAHHDGAVLADSLGTCCPPHLRSNAKCKSTEKGKYQISLFTFPDSCQSTGFAARPQGSPCLCAELLSLASERWR